MKMSKEQIGVGVALIVGAIIVLFLHRSSLTVNDSGNLPTGYGPQTFGPISTGATGESPIQLGDVNIGGTDGGDGFSLPVMTPVSNTSGGGGGCGGCCSGCDSGKCSTGSSFSLPGITPGQIDNYAANIDNATPGASLGISFDNINQDTANALAAQAAAASGWL